MKSVRNSRNPLFLLLVGIMALQACSGNGTKFASSSGDAWSVNPAYDTGLVWFYKPPEDDLIPLLPSHFDFYILTHKDEEERNLLRTLGVDAPIPNYLLFSEIHDPGDCEETPRGNQVAFLPGDFCRISAEHPDWFLLDTFGDRIVDENDYYNMDFGHPGFQEFWRERAAHLQAQYGWQGVFIDNVEASLSKYARNGALPIKYPTDASLQKAVEDFLKYLQQGDIGPLYANIISLQNNEIWLRYLNHLDGAMLENFAVDWRDSELSPSEWVSEMDMLLESQRLGNTLILISQGDRDDLERQKFAYASYLLVNEGLAYFRYAHHSSYREIWLYENYEYELGKPLGPMYQQGNEWMRDFEYGQIVVNPKEQTANILLKKAVP